MKCQYIEGSKNGPVWTRGRTGPSTFTCVPASQETYLVNLALSTLEILLINSQLLSHYEIDDIIIILLFCSSKHEKPKEESVKSEESEKKPEVSGFILDLFLCMFSNISCI